MKQPDADFASGAMVRVLMQGLIKLGLSPAWGPASSAATVPLDLKRDLIEHAIRQGGLRCLVLLGRGLHDLGAEPTHLALTAVPEGQAVLQRWQRLERYVHSRHRTVLHEAGPSWAVIEHISKEGHPPPLPVEDLVVCGVLCALLEASGCTDVEAQSNGCMLYPAPSEDAVSALVRSGRSREWRLCWRMAPTGLAGSDRPAVEAALVPAQWTPWVQQVAAQLMTLLPEAPSVSEAAQAHAMSTRSFQRSLGEQGLSFRALLGEMRFRKAGRCLVVGAMPLAEVGFISGYADQAHFTRDFQVRAGLTPARYRELFAVQTAAEASVPHRPRRH